MSDQVENYGAYVLFKMNDGTFRVGSSEGPQIKDYGGSVYRGGDVVAADNFNGSTAVLFSSGHLWYVDGSWTKAPTGPNGKDTENITASEMTAYFFSNSPPSTYGDGDSTPDPAPQPVDLGEFGRFSSVTEAIAYAEGAGSQGPITIRSDGSLINQNGELMGYDSDGNLAPYGMAPPINAPVPEPEPVPEPVGTPSSGSGVEIESNGAYSLFKMDDGTYRVGSTEGPQIKDYGGIVYPGGDIVAIDNFNGSTAVLFSSGHLWYVDGSWTKAPAGPNGKDTETLSASEMTAYFFTDTPPPTYGDETQQPVELGEFGRFSSVAEAIAYAEGAGNQGPITVRSDGSLVNQNGQLMRYDSDGNLAPYGMAVPIDSPTAEPAELGEFGRFSSAAEAIAYAEGAGGQGPITIRLDGSLVNQYGELMSYDSDGNLAPSGSAPPIDEPEDVMPTIPAGLPAEQFDALLGSPSGAELVQQIESIGVDYILATVSEEQVALVLSKFGEDPAFIQWLELVTSSDQSSDQEDIPPTTTEEPPVQEEVSQTTSEEPAEQVTTSQATSEEPPSQDPISEEAAARALAEEEFNSLISMPDGEALVSVLQKIDLGRIASEISAEQVDQILEKFGEDEVFISYVNETLGTNISVESLESQDYITHTGADDDLGLVGVLTYQPPSDFLG